MSDWKELEGKLVIELEFNDFKEAFGFMSKVADLAEEHNHHPEWSNVYNRVEVNLITHEVGGITKRDFKMARAMDRFAS